MKVAGIFLIIVLVFQQTSAAENTCQSCHQQVQSNCNLTCQDCHLSPKAHFRPAVKDHPAIIKNPSIEAWWQEKCLTCHEVQIHSFKNSLHYSSAGIIDQTRFLFGKNRALLQTGPETWKELRAVRSFTKPDARSVVDHLLASKCMACHFEADQRRDVPGRKHAAGCAACHVALDQQTGKALHGHRFQKSVEDQVCLTCHSGNRVGADYYGYFERDYHRQYAEPFGTQPQFGTYQHHLRSDVHQQAGLHCTDCHREHVPHKKALQYEGQMPQVRCQDCHGGFAGQGASENEKRKPTVSANVRRLAKPFDRQVIAHRDFHRNVRCSACHAQWSFQDYGLHLFLDQSRDYELWEDYLWQGDGELLQFLQQALRLPKMRRPKAVSLNKLSGQKMAGLWFMAWTFRRWEVPVLGRDTRGKVSIIRPLYQYRITLVDSLNQVWLDSQIPRRQDGKIGWNWDAYVPHTIGQKGRDCLSCHLNPKAVGQGIKNNSEEENAQPITQPTELILPHSCLLNDLEQKRLLHKSPLYKTWRARQLWQNGIFKLLNEQ